MTHLAAVSSSTSSISDAGFVGIRWHSAHTAPGFVYFLATKDGFCKIGRTNRLSRRIRNLNIQLPFKVELVHAIITDDPAWVERHYHSKFEKKRANGEWFKLSTKDFEQIKLVGAREIWTTWRDAAVYCLQNGASVTENFIERADRYQVAI